jgi:hypothetical protein
MFEKASRLAIRFDSPKGLLTVEDLWPLPLTVRNGGASLDNIAKSLNRQIKDTDTESFVIDTPKTDEVTQLKFDIVKHVIGVRKAEAEQAAKAADTRAKKQQIMALIADKQNEELKGTSLADLQKMLDAL